MPEPINLSEERSLREQVRELRAEVTALRTQLEALDRGIYRRVVRIAGDLMLRWMDLRQARAARGAIGVVKGALSCLS